MLTRSKPGSFTYQIIERLHELNRIGESKHQAKLDFRKACEYYNIPWNPAQAEGIFSVRTMNAYKQTAFEFTTWIKDKHSENKDLMNIPKEHAIEYLQHRQSEGKSAWTISKDMSAINKVCNLHVTKEEAGLHERSYRNVTRSRLPRAHDEQYNPEHYKRQTSFAQAFGCRRESIRGGAYQVKPMSLFRHNSKVYVNLIEKGGKFRAAPCLESMQPTIERMFPGIEDREPLTESEFKALYEASNQGPLFASYSSKIDNHAFRAEYARNLYSELLANVKGPGETYRGYDKASVTKVSQALGHNRLSVVVESYFR